MKWLFSECRRWQVSLSLLASNELESRQRAELERHLETCSACRARLAELRAVVQQCESLGAHLPETLPSPALRRRWLTAVKQPSSREAEATSGILPSWFFGPPLRWGSLGAVWLLILLFRFSAPEQSAPAVALAPTSLKEIMLVLATDSDDSPFVPRAARTPTNRHPEPQKATPRTQNKIELERKASVSARSTLCNQPRSTV